MLNFDLLVGFIGGFTVAYAILDIFVVRRMTNDIRELVSINKEIMGIAQEAVDELARRDEQKV